MMKRALSLLLCLIMVLGVVAPTVQATDDVYTTSGNIMDNITIDGDINGNVVIDGNTVTSSGDTKLPYPTDWLNQENATHTFGEPVKETPVAEYVCKCADLSSAVDHVGICQVKAPYIKQCEVSEQELFALWGSYTLEEQEYMLSHLRNTYPVKYAELLKLLNAPTGSASETLTDGTTVSVQGIPQDGALTVGEAAGNIKDIVDAYVAEQETVGTELFSYDVSVQDGEGADWQPETNVKMELELPDVKLHKYSKVYVVHVDDQGNASTIEATVTEDGKIAFETPGFSTFAGFTVDFDYEGATFSIPGMTSIKLSALFENLKMPLNAQDVVNVQYTDSTQIKIEKLEGDWLLTSLKAFQTEEKLTLTMADGSVYKVKVTDATDITNQASFYSVTDNDVTGYYIEGPNASSPNGVIQLYLPTSSSGNVTSKDANGDICDDAYLVVNGRDKAGCLEIILQEPDNNTTNNNTVYWNLWGLRIVGGAHVVIRLGASFEGGETIKIVRQKSRAMFDIEDGSSLYFNLSSDDLEHVTGVDSAMIVQSAKNIKIVLDGGTHANQKEDALVYCGYSAKKLLMNNVTFQNCEFRGIFALTEDMTIMSIRNAKFESTVKYKNGAGGAIRIADSTLNEEYVKICGRTYGEDEDELVLIRDLRCINVIFDGNSTSTSTGSGGGFCCTGNLDKTLFEDCDFLNCYGYAYGGGFYVGNGQESFNTNDFTFRRCLFQGCSTSTKYGAAVTFRDKCGNIEFDDCDFVNNTAKTHAGAVNISNDDYGVQAWNITFNKCDFINNTATGNRGGAIRMVLKTYITTDNELHNPDVTIKDCTFDNNTAGSYGGAISLVGQDGTIGSINDVNISGCAFTNCSSVNSGGAVLISDAGYNSITIQNTSFDNCVSPRYGGALCLRAQAEGKTFTVNGNISILGCDFSDCHAGYISMSEFADVDKNGNGPKKLPRYWDHDQDPSTPDIQMLNGVGGGGAIAMGGTVGGSVLIKGTSENDKSKFENCTSWNNGGVLIFTNDMVINGNNPVDSNASAVELQFLDIDKCFARDAGFAIYLGEIYVPSFVMSKCDVKNCGFFDLTDTNFPKENVFPVNNGKLEDKWFVTPTVYKKSGDTWVKEDDTVQKQYDTSYLAAWKTYSQEDLCYSTDTGGTFRSIGNTFCIADITDCTFVNNKCFAHGAAVYWNSLQIDESTGTPRLPSLTLTRTVFDGNKAYRDGGAIYCEATVTILSCEFKNNVAVDRGGAIAQQVYNNEFRPLGKSGDDEANRIILGSDDITGVPTKLHHNKATNGGAVAITVTKTESVPDGTLYNYPMEFQLGGSHVYENVATQNGGGIYYATYTYEKDEDQDEVDYFEKNIQLDDGLIWGNVAGAMATEITGNYTPQVGDQFVFKAVDSNITMSSTQNTDHRPGQDATTYNPQNLVFGSQTQVFTLEEGNIEGTFALRIAPGQYLGIGDRSDGDHQLSNVPYSKDSSAWTISVNSSGEATMTVKARANNANLRSILNYNTGNANGDWFNVYVPSKTQKAISIYRVNYAGHNGGNATLVTNANVLQPGDSIIIKAKDYNVLMSTSYDATTRKTTSEYTFQTANTITFDEGTQMLKLVHGTVDGTYALQLTDGTYLRTTSTGTVQDGANRLEAQSTLDANSSWTIAVDIATGEATITSKATNARNTIYYNSGGWFNNYTLNNTGSDIKPILIYRVNHSSGSLRTATLVTKNYDVREGDLIVIVAKDYDHALSTVQDGYTRDPAPITRKNTIKFDLNTQVVTLVPGSIGGTFALQTGEGEYLAGGWDKLITSNVINADSSWTVSITGGKLTAVNHSPNPCYIRYEPTHNQFNTFGNATSQLDIVVYKLGIEGGGNGGGVYMNSNQIETSSNSGYSHVTITGGSIYKNIAYIGNGGGVYLTGQNALCTINGETTTIGAQYLGKTDDGKVNLSLHGGNSVSGTSQQSAGNGGGIAIFGGARIEMTGGYVVNNTATVAGGGIAVHSESSMWFSDGTVEGNSAHMGGGISLNNAVAINNSPTASTPDQDRYGMFLDGGNVKNNKVTPDAEGIAYGGGICISAQSTMKISGGMVSGNMAASDLAGTQFNVNQQGGGIAVCQNSSMVIAGGSIDSNKAGSGGGIVVRGASELTMTGSVSVAEDGTVTYNGAILNNRVRYFGGGVYLADYTASTNGNRMTIEGGYIYNNAATITEETNNGNCLGGGILVDENASITISGGLIDHNRAYNGGGIYAWKGHVSLDEGVMSNNEASRYGGALYNDYSDITMTGGELKNNKANPANVKSTDLGHGGAIFNYGTSSDPYEITISNGIFSDNTASLYGGAICSEGTGQTTITGGTFTGNKVTNTVNLEANGGALYIANGTTLISGGNFENNSALNYGGGAYFKNTTDVDFTTGTFIGNSSKNGGGLCIDNATVEFTGGQFEENVADNGGALYINSSTVNIKNIAANNNQANNNGGGAWIGNTSGGQATMTVTGGSFNNNIAIGNGGGVYVENQATAKILSTATGHGEINGNTASNGGGVYVTNGAKLEVNNGHITNNNAVAATMPNLSSAYGNDASLAGVGGGICVTAGTANAKSSFTLTGTLNSSGRMDVAIFGNSATFAADDVFASGNNTELDVPTIDQMNLAGYGFKPEAWTEDYVNNDSCYVDYGTRMLTDTLISELGISRYRSASPTARKHMVISASTINSIVNAPNRYVCMTLGIPGATKDTVLIDYDTNVDIDVWQNDLFMEKENFVSGKVYIGETFPEGALHKDGISCSEGNMPLANVVKDKNGNDVYDRYPVSFNSTMGVIKNNNLGILSFNADNMGNDASFEFYYTVERAGFWYYASVNVIPATNIYFEDNNASITYHTTSEYEKLATWSPVGSASNEGQSQDRPGASLLDGLDAENIYGFDGNYSDTTSYSGGSAHKVTVNRHLGVDDNGDGKCDAKDCGVDVQLTHDYVAKNATGQCKICLNTQDKHGFDVPAHECHEYKTYNQYCDYCGKWIGTHTVNARATFTFTGTGFDVVGLSSVDTGVVMVTIYKGKITDFDNVIMREDFDDIYVASFMVDTYYGYVYNAEKGKWEPSDASDAVFYQVPSIKADMTKIMIAQDDPSTKDVDETRYEDYGYGTYSVEIYIAPSYLEREHGYWNADFYLDGIRVYNPAGIGGANSKEAYDAYIADGENWPVYAELRNMFITQKDLGVNTTKGIIFIDGRVNATIDEYKTWGPNNEVYLNPGESVAFTLNASNYAMSAGGNSELSADIVAGVHLGMRGLTGLGKVTIYDGKNAYKTIDMGTTDMYYDIMALMNKVVTITNQGETPISLSNVKITHKYAPVVTGKMGDLFTMDTEAANIALNVFTAEQLADPVLTPKYPALSFEGMVSYNVFFTAEDLGSLNGADLGLAVFDSYNPEGTVENAKDVIMGATQIDGLYMVATNGVHAKYLGDTQYFRAFAKKADGSYVYSKMVSYSALDYAKNVLSKSNDVKLKQLVVAMLNYGSEAQKFFGYKTDDLMNKNLTVDEQALVSGIHAGSLNAVGKVDASKVGIFASTGGFAKKYPAISFKGAFEINYFMAPSNVVDGGMRLYIWNEDTYNAVSELAVNNADKVVSMTLENGLYTASSDQIIAKNLDKTVYVAAVYESNGVSYCSGVLPYSIAAYCQKPSADVADLANAAAVYGCAAKEFFGV